MRTKEQKEKYNIRLNRIAGQVNGIKNMINDDRYCIDIIYQLKACINGLEKIEKYILNEHINSCVKNAILNEDLKILDELKELLKIDERNL